MTSIDDEKRLNDDELEAVAGGVRAPTMDPALLAAQSAQSALDAALAIAGGGAHPVDTHTPAPDSHSSTTGSGAIATGTITIDLSSMHDLLPKGTNETAPLMQVAHFDPSHGTFTKITPTVNGEAPSPGLSNRLGLGFNTTFGEK